MSAPGAAQQLPQKNWGDYSCVVFLRGLIFY
jgi:hypothetical protein